MKKLAVQPRQHCLVRSSGASACQRRRRRNVKNCEVVRCLAALAERKDASTSRKGSDVNTSLGNSHTAEYVGPHSLSLSLTPTSSLGSQQSLFSSIAMGYRLTDSLTKSQSQWDDDESNLIQETERLRAAALMWIDSLKLHNEYFQDSGCKSTSQEEEVVAQTYGHLPIVTGDIAFEKYLSYEEGAGINPVTTAIRGLSQHLETPIILYTMNDFTSNGQKHNNNYYDKSEAPLFVKVFSAGEEYSDIHTNLGACIHLVYDDMEMTYKLLFPTPDAN